MRTSLFVFAMLTGVACLVLGPAVSAQETAPEDKPDPAGEPGEKAPGEKPVPPDDGKEAPKPAEPEKPPEKPDPAAMEEELQKAKEYFKHPDTGVEVVLKNGTVFEGIARKGVLAESKELEDVGNTGRKEQVFRAIEGEALRLRPGEKSVYVPVPLKKKVWIRIWYFRETKGFISIDFGDIVEIRVTRVLTYHDSKKLFQAIEDKEKGLLNAERQVRDEEKKREELKQQSDREDREKDLAKQKGLDAQAAEKRKEWRKDLLTKFPPAAGWNKDRKTQIMVKMVKGVDPSPEEKEFYNRFKEWEEAVKEEEFLKGK